VKPALQANGISNMARSVAVTEDQNTINETDLVLQHIPSTQAHIKIGNVIKQFASIENKTLETIVHLESMRPSPVLIPPTSHVTVVRQVDERPVTLSGGNYSKTFTENFGRFNINKQRDTKEIAPDVSSTASILSSNPTRGNIVLRSSSLTKKNVTVTNFKDMLGVGKTFGNVISAIPSTTTLTLDPFKKFEYTLSPKNLGTNTNTITTALTTALSSNNVIMSSVIQNASPSRPNNGSWIPFGGIEGIDDAPEPVKSNDQNQRASTSIPGKRPEYHIFQEKKKETPESEQKDEEQNANKYNKSVNYAERPAMNMLPSINAMKSTTMTNFNRAATAQSSTATNFRKVQPLGGPAQKKLTIKDLKF
jgi:hypothetical protein